METKETIQSVKFMLFMLSPRGDFGDDFNFCRMLDIFSGYFLWRDIGNFYSVKCLLISEPLLTKTTDRVVAPPVYKEL